MGAARRNSDPTNAPWARARHVAIAAVLALLTASGCAHKTVIRTRPEGARVYVDGEYAGDAPVVVKRYAGTGGELRVRAELDEVLEGDTQVERTDWFLWPALLAITPLLGLPTLFVPFLGPFLCGGWALLTSPTLAGLCFLRRYPHEVTLMLMPRLGEEGAFVLPTDDWTVPRDYAPNPLPLFNDEKGRALPQADAPSRRDGQAPNPSPLPELRY
jgi:hypothetical protein